MKKAIYLDMDGTIANLYAMNDWLPKLRAYSTEPYRQAKPICNMVTLAHLLNTLQKQGYHIGIISWLSKEPTPAYDKAVTSAKREWLGEHLKSVQFDEIKIVSYGIPKSTMVKYPNGILFDDELPNRQEWKGTAYDEKNLLENLKKLVKNT